jgi:outer membrane protein OmpA-like peptidoglycan-associated protein
MEIKMSTPMISYGQLAALSAIFLLGACAQTPPQAVGSYQAPLASNPPPVPPGPNAVWYHVSFNTNAVAIGPDGQSVVADVTTYLQGNPNTIATIIGRTDTVGSQDYNMHLSHQRADAVRDALVYRGNVAADRVETRWTGETRLKVATAGDTAEASNRVVDIAIH